MGATKACGPRATPRRASTQPPVAASGSPTPWTDCRDTELEPDVAPNTTNEARTTRPSECGDACRRCGFEFERRARGRNTMRHKPATAKNNATAKRNEKIKCRRRRRRRRPTRWASGQEGQTEDKRTTEGAAEHGNGDGNNASEGGGGERQNAREGPRGEETDESGEQKQRGGET